MGEDWGEIDLGRAAMRQSIAAAHQEDIAPGGAPMPPCVPGHSAQAVVKMVRTGGARNVAGLKAQMTYLARQGGVELQRSERFMGIAIDDEEVANMVRAWAMPTDGEARADRTSHFIVSFSQGTDAAAAERAGRAWAEEMFGSGAYGGDSFDYYTAFHTDRDHPHIHVVVHRRGLDNGTWLKVSKRSAFNYQAMRELAVEVGKAEGIDLEATPRFARGVHDRTVPDAEYRRAVSDGRAPAPPKHSEVSAIRTAAAIIHYARRFAAEAKLLEHGSPDTAKALQRVATTIAAGQALSEQSERTRPEDNADIGRQLAHVRAETRARFAKMDKTLADFPDGPDRIRLMRQVAALKTEAGPHMNGSELSDFQRAATHGRYEGFVATDAKSTALKTAAEEAVRRIAERYDVNGEATVERYSGGVPSKALAEQYGAAEARERARARQRRGAFREAPERRQSVLGRMHDEIAAVYRDTREQARAGVAVKAEPPCLSKPLHSGRSRVEHADRAAEGPTRKAEANRQEHERAEQERKNAERKARERGGGRGL
ncbi:relaxase/mobilization nuclease domain-containing protein [Acuticoccus sediminis]|nr:relaxase/mobilization nuclease domain-containing protein [Acuticoccus sediminis]